MKNNLDFEKIRHILEKIESGESLNKSEKAYLDIINVLKTKKNNKIEINNDFKANLKKRLLIKYDELYKKKDFLDKFSSIMQILPQGHFFQGEFLRFTVSFCLIFSITLWIYSNINFSYTGKVNTIDEVKINSSSINSESIPSQDNSKDIAPEIMSTKEENKVEIPNERSDKKVEMKDNINNSSDSVQFWAESRSWLKFENATNFSVNDWIKWLSDESLLLRISSIIKENLGIVGILIFSIIASLLIAFKRKKK